MANLSRNKNDKRLVEFLQRIFDRIPVGLYRTTPEGRIIHANLALARMLGYESVEDLKSRDLEIEGYEPSYPRKDFKERIEREGSIHGLDARWRRTDGTFVDVREYAEAVRDGSGKVVFYDGAVEDVTEFKNAEKTIMEREREYRSLSGMFRLLADNMQDMLWAKDLQGRYLFANRALCERILNASDTSEPIGKTDMYFAERERGAHPEDPEWHTFGEICAGSDAETLRVKGPCQFEEFGNAQGQSLFLDVRKAPLVDEGVDIIGVVGSAREVSREKELESEQRRSRKELEEAYQRLRSTQESTLRVMAKLVETRDPYTSGHQGRVALLAVAIAREMGLDEETREVLRVASLVHDIGKLRIPIEILSKPGHLAPMEMELIKEHSRAGAEIISEIRFFRPVDEIILQHHERLDGSGYPRGLSGEQILIEARILAVADVVEAMSADRPYRPSMGVDVALEEIRSRSGRLFDPEVVRVCCQLFESGRFGF
jgi:PAS domain S-box-containing protein/putative nucleotidyltransferase with HDIG domain